jgi:DNA-binding PadR family transcriptional regulator
MGMTHAVLGAAKEGPASRYELLMRLRRDFPLWNFSSGGVYHAVDKLTPHLLCPCDGDEPTGDYELTPAGDVRLRAWVRRPSQPGPFRDDLRLQIAYSEPEDLPGLEQQIHERLRWIGRQQAALRDLSHLREVRRLQKPWSVTRLLVARAIQLAVLDGLARGLRRAQAEIIDAIQQHAAQQSR